MQYDFDEIIDRKNTNSLKYDFASERGKPEDVLSLWVADMDFRAPKEVIDALVKASTHGIFGYSDTKETYFNSLHDWYLERFDWKLKASWLVKAPGVVFAIYNAITALTQKGDAVMIQKPVYYPFSSAILDNERQLVNNSLVYENGSYRMDLEDFEKKIVDHHVKMFILCSPHNPVGRVWTKEELTCLGDICLKHNVIVVADEIHADFVFSGYKHTIFADIKPAFSDICITCTAPSKTFNLAGLQISNIFISNVEMRKKFKKQIVKTGYSQLNTMGLIANDAAYTYGRDWLEQLKKYLEANLTYLRDFIKRNIPGVKLVEPEGTYLVWLDFHGLHLNEEEKEELVLRKAKLWLDGGSMFGEEGIGFERINIACPRKILEKALNQLSTAIQSLK